MTSETETATRANFESLLDSGRLECLMSSGRWWRIRRNGKTQTWKRNPAAIRVPFKMGLRGHGAIVESDFLADGTLNPAFYRVVD
jgi:hypothetical protein